ncbi:beta carbonic anhydrase 5, chloroplastic-like isoform X1 [Arachis stenosperma]|uniref:beta carbonic anhydrase 5, chloroplastic-like isoform X1 n=1 Tax=Arachis stenosperma TaxID=217475 RepID=UPI0025ACA3ED|nr:beta carbonic anhydrase 5, chloroplastic-like isoform X1 [Arachis stenosperma]
MAAPAPLSVSAGDPLASKSLPLSSSRGDDAFRASTIFGRSIITAKIQHTHLKLFTDSRQGFSLKAFAQCQRIEQHPNKSKLQILPEVENKCDIFSDLKDRFLGFKKNKYLKNIEHFQELAQAQAPKFMVIACADSRVCPSHILGFHPGEAFMIRNVGNLVPPFESGPSETNAALEFAVNTLEVEHILVIGHSCCGGIRALMSMQDDANESSSSSFINSWVVVGKNARIKTEAAASQLNFDQQCSHCEKESVNNSLLNLLTYPWIEEKVANGKLNVHGGYYDFIDCSFEKWTMSYRETKMAKNSRIAAVNKMFWC